MYKYIVSLLKAPGIFRNIIFRVRGSFSEFKYRHSLQYRRGRGRPKSNGYRCDGRDGQSFSLCGGHKRMTPKWKDYRNPCKNLKFLICTLYVSKLSQANYWHRVKVGPGPQDSGPQDLGTGDLGPLSKFKSGTAAPPSKFKSGTPERDFTIL